MRYGVAVLPNAITAANMALGLYSIISSINGNWAVAAWCIIASIIVDIMDGRVARWTKSSGDFGIEFDSLADLVSFGVAPALMMYLLVLQDYGRIGIAIAILFVICGALRLARFNVKAHSHEEEAAPYFVGLPIPAAGGILASFVILYDIWSEGKNARTIQIVMKQIPAFYHLLPGIIFVLSLLMVSGLRYSSFKKMNLIKPRSMRAFLTTILIVMMIYIYPQNTIFVIFVGYICSGFIEFVWRAYRMHRNPPIQDLNNKTSHGETWK